MAVIMWLSVGFGVKFKSLLAYRISYMVQKIEKKFYNLKPWFIFFVLLVFSLCLLGNTGFILYALFNARHNFTLPYSYEEFNKDCDFIATDFTEEDSFFIFDRSVRSKKDIELVSTRFSTDGKKLWGCFKYE